LIKPADYAIFQVMFHVDEPVSKRFGLSRGKAGTNFGRRNTLPISRIKLAPEAEIEQNATVKSALM
jgi:hypothetical protein